MTSAVEFIASYAPTTESIQLAMNMQTSSQIEIEVFTVDGQLALQSEKLEVAPGETTHVISAAQLTTGIYIVTVRIGNQVATQRVSITK